MTDLPDVTEDHVFLTLEVTFGLPKKAAEEGVDAVDYGVRMLRDAMSVYGVPVARVERRPTSEQLT
ncbi:MAG: hypothetical protein ACRD0G_19715 [Acidimicrobiales bacterium]